MSNKTAPKTLHYRQVRTLQNNGAFQAHLAQALKQRPQTGQRKEVLNEEERIYRLVNSHTERKGMQFGQLLVYSEGQHQGLITIDEDAEEMAIAHEPPSKDQKGRRRELLQSILYFGIWKNHALLLQSASLQAKHLEAHLGWLLGECTKVLHEDDGVILSNVPSPETVRKIENAPIKRASFGAPLRAEPVNDEGTMSVTQAKKVRYVPAGKGFAVVRAMLGDDFFKGQEFNDALDEGNLQVALEVSYQRKTTKNAHKLLNTIGTAMRHLDPHDVRIDLDGGGYIKGNELHLQHEVRLDIHGGKVDHNVLYDLMYEWMMESIENGVLSA